MNEQNKARLEKLNKYLIESLERDTGLKVFQDNVSETELKEELDEVYQYIIFSTGGFTKPDTSKFTLIQSVTVQVAAETISDLDGLQLDIITSLNGVADAGPYYFLSSDKGQIQKGKQDKYVDALTFEFTRSIKNVC
ncbi:hypothetical protein HB825_05645 [Listeria booriae]|uniref:hypothetical protein n=1 Tax=Listeria booriae TaxID=1552123 RepID=UPI00164DC3D6|nr:hypothetical protein [Listeria booriae]MBC6134321.1 hypothetical protein [Listeria booriae]